VTGPSGNAAGDGTATAANGGLITHDRVRRMADGGDVSDPYAQLMQSRSGGRVSPGQFVRGGFDTAAGMLKGATQAAIGMPGDIESLIRMGVGSEREAVLPTTDRVKAFIDKYAPLGLPTDEGTDGRTAAEYFGEFMSPAAATRPLVRGAQVVGEGIMEGARQAAPVVEQAARQATPAAREMLESMPAGLSVKPTGSFTPMPTPEAPFVGRLDQFAASMPGPMKKDQLLGTLKGKFKDYEIERANRALADLPDDARVMPTDFLNRLNNVNNPANYRTTVIDPEPSSFWQQHDNVFYDPEKMGSGALGVIHLHRFRDPAQEAAGDVVKEAQTALNTIESSNNPQRFEALLTWARSQPDAEQLEAFLTKGPVAEAQRELAALDKLKDIQNDLLFPSLSKNFNDTLDAETLRVAKTLEERGVPAYRAKIEAYEEARDSAANILFARGREQWKELGLPGEPPTVSSEITGKNILMPWQDKAYDSAVNSALREKTKVILDNAEQKLEPALPALQQLEGRIKMSPEMPYMGRHSSLRNPPETIAFSRFSEHTADIPGLGRRKGIYVTELQSDLFNDIRRLRKNDPRGGVTEAKEAFPKMADLPQVTQQLLIKNAINAAMQRGDQFVAFPGTESAKPQLYEKTPRNIADVVKELGPGFTRVPIELTLPNGKPAMFEGVTWSPEAVQRTQKQGIPFSKGGMVERKTSDNRSYK
jgi:hypothetical protein